MAESWTGGCACGAVRYALKSAPYDTGWCHCRICQRVSGSPAIVFSTVPHGHLVFTKGADKVKPFASTSFGRRRFCGECGTPLTIEVDHQPETVDFSVATLDAPDAVSPGFHIFWASRIPWFDPGDALPRYDRFRPETRGLQGTDGPL